MGDARNNPRSPQYNGPLPDVIPGCGMEWVVVPTEEWLKQAQALKEAGVEGPYRLHDKDRVVVIKVITQWTVPMRSVDQRGWPTSSVAVYEFPVRIPLTEFKKLHKANFAQADLKFAADSIAIAEEPLITES